MQNKNNNTYNNHAPYTVTLKGHENLTQLKEDCIKEYFNKGQVPTPNNIRMMTPGKLIIQASGDKIDLAVKLALMLRNEVKLHMVTKPAVHCPYPQQSISDGNRLTRDSVEQKWPNRTCEQKFDLLLQHKTIPGIKILLSQEKINSDEVGYQRPEPPLKPMKSKINNKQFNNYKNKENYFHPAEKAQITRNANGEINGYYQHQHQQNDKNLNNYKHISQQQSQKSSNCSVNKSHEQKQKSNSSALKQGAITDFSVKSSDDNQTTIQRIDSLKISKNSNSLMNNSSEPIENKRLSSSNASACSQKAKHVSFSDGHTSEASNEHMIVEKKFDQPQLKVQEYSDQGDFIFSKLS